MSELAQTRAADHHDAASRAREASKAQQESPSTPATPLDAYPRQYGLAVTIERTAVNGATPVPRTARLRFRPMPRWIRVHHD